MTFENTPSNEPANDTADSPENQAEQSLGAVAGEPTLSNENQIPGESTTPNVAKAAESAKKPEEVENPARYRIPTDLSLPPPFPAVAKHMVMAQAHLDEAERMQLVAVYDKLNEAYYRRFVSEANHWFHLSVILRLRMERIRTKKGAKVY